MQRHSFSTKVEKQKNEQRNRFSSWLFCKSKKKDRKALTENGERRSPRSRHSSVEDTSSKRASLTGAKGVPAPSLQRQQSFLRQQLLEMKRQSNSMLIVPPRKESKEKEDEEGDAVPVDEIQLEDNQLEGVDDDAGRRQKDTTIDDMEEKGDHHHEEAQVPAENNNQLEEDGKSGSNQSTEADTETETGNELDRPRKSLRHSNQVMEESDSEEDEPPMEEFDALDDDESRPSVYTEDAHRHLNQATQLYAEALSHLLRAQASLFSRPSTTKAPVSPAVQPQPEPQPKRPSKARRSRQSEWI